jgi:hypothetical protein
MGNIRRISLFGSAGSGKSTMAARLYADLKMQGQDIELIQEYIKPRAYEKRFPTSFDQVHIFWPATPSRRSVVAPRQVARHRFPGADERRLCLSLWMSLVGFFGRDWDAV